MNVNFFVQKEMELPGGMEVKARVRGIAEVDLAEGSVKVSALWAASILADTPEWQKGEDGRWRYHDRAVYQRFDRCNWYWLKPLWGEIEAAALESAQAGGLPIKMPVDSFFFSPIFLDSEGGNAQALGYVPKESEWIFS